MKYDKEEKILVDAYEKGKMKLSKPSKKEIEAIKATARKTLGKDRRITIRLYDHDYHSIEAPCTVVCGITPAPKCRESSRQGINFII